MSDSLTERLLANQEAVRAAFHLPAAVLARSYAPGKWSGRAVLLHITDTEQVFLDRLRRALCDAKPLLWAIDPDRWAERLHGDWRSLAVAEAQFAASRASTIELLGALAESDWERAAIHSEAGRLTVRQIAAKIVDHAQHHLDQVVKIATA